MPAPKDPKKYEEYRQKMISASRKLWDTPELRAKTITSMKKKKLSEEHKRKIGISISGERNPMKIPKNVEAFKQSATGKPKSKEHRKKLSAARIGMKPSEETKEKYRIRKRQLATDPDYRRRNSESVILAKNEIWYGGVKYCEDEQYCELWTAELRIRWTRANRRCAR